MQHATAKVLSITSRALVASGNEQVTEPMVKVDQHSPRKPGAYDLCPGITTSELFITLTKRLTEMPEQLSDVDKFYLFSVWTELDRHLTESSQSAYEELVTDVPVKSAFASCTGDDDEDVDNWELRTLFRQDAINDILELESDSF